MEVPRRLFTITPRGKIQSLQGLRSAFCEYFVSKGHTSVSSSSLIATGDPSLLFVNSGMVQFKNVFAGHEKRLYNRAVTCQKCLRVSGKHNDFENIGKTARHHTFFEMLGNFSFGDYFKQDAIKYAWEFLTEIIGLPKSLLWVSVHERDEEARILWQKNTDILPERIVKLGDASNLWAMGDQGPWGYCSEIFCYIGQAPDEQNIDEFMKDDGTYLEIWNLVFMEFFRHANGEITKLPLQCIDTGMGLERLASVVQGVQSNFDTEDLRSIIRLLEDMTGIQYDGSSFCREESSSESKYDTDVAMRVIADHSRAVAFLIADGIVPGNEGENYVLRRLLRRAIRFGAELNLSEPFMKHTVRQVIHSMGESYPELHQHKEKILALVDQEEARFRVTLDHGISLLNEALVGKASGYTLPGDIAFKLYDTFGFPVDLTRDVLFQLGMFLDDEGYAKSLEAQRERSRVGSSSFFGDGLSQIVSSKDCGSSRFTGYDSLEEQAKIVAVLPPGADNLQPLFVTDTPFYAEMGGQIGDSGTVTIGGINYPVVTTRKIDTGAFAHFINLSQGLPPLDARQEGESVILRVDAVSRQRICVHHSATHILNSVLRKVLGSHVIQRGSYVADGGLRFDFSHSSAVSHSDIKNIENIINEEIRSNHPVVTQELTLDAAKALGAIATFGEKYGEIVRVVQIGQSIELCGGTHVKSSGEIGFFMIESEGSVSAGVRRIEGKAGKAGILAFQESHNILHDLSGVFKTSAKQLTNKVEALVTENKLLIKELKARDSLIARLVAKDLAMNPSVVSTSATGNIKLVAANVEITSKELMLDIASEVLTIVGSGVVVVASKQLGAVVIKVSKSLTSYVSANELVKSLAPILGGKGGGKPDSAFIGGVEPNCIDEALTKIANYL
jgi:alanyl-tRNA synthetase